jgi:hypothetical protein
MPTEAFGEIVTLSEYKLVALYIRNWLCWSHLLRDAGQILGWWTSLETGEYLS